MLIFAWSGLAAISLVLPNSVQAAEQKTMRPKALAILSAQAIQSFRNGDFLHAIGLYRELVKINPGDALSWQLLGQSLAGANDPRSAKQAYQKSLELNSDGPIATATKDLLTKLPAPDPRTVQVDNALTLADWLPLADEMVRQGKRLWVLERNGKILAAHGEIPQVEALQDQLVRDVLLELPLTDFEGAKAVLAMVQQLKPLAPGNLTVFRYEGLACHTLRNFDCAQLAYSKWMQQAAPSDPERPMVSRLLLQSREQTALDEGVAVTQLGVSVLAMKLTEGSGGGEPQFWVQSVIPGGIGERLGLQRGDVITRAGDNALTSAKAIQDWADNRVSTSSWQIDIQRGTQGMRLALEPSKEELALVADEAFRLYFAGEFKTAAARLQELVTLLPDDTLSWFLLGLCHQGAKEDAAARAAFTRAMQLGKESKVGKEAKEKLAVMPQPDPYTIKLDNGLTLGDWISLQHERPSAANVAEILEAARGYETRYGPLPALASLMKDMEKRAGDEVLREVEAVLRGIRLRNVTEADQALPQLVRVKAKMPNLPSLLRAEARACHLIKFYSCAEAAYSEWLLAVPADDPRRRKVINALFMAQQRKPLPDNAMATGRVVKHCEVCPEMVEIGSGAYETEDSIRGTNGNFDKTFALGRTEVTQAQWNRLMGGNPSEFKSCGPDCPVENVSWHDAQEYIKRLSKLTGMPYRLPSEIEWEVACRAGEDTEYCGSGDLGEIAWYGAYGTGGGNTGKTTHPVAARRVNAWGIHDMSGNVREWVADSWQENIGGPLANASARNDERPRKVVKGGSWVSRPNELKSSYREWDMATDRYFFTGFRVAVTLER